MEVDDKRFETKLKGFFCLDKKMALLRRRNTLNNRRNALNKHLFAGIRNLFYWSEWGKCGKSSFLTDSFFLFLIPRGNIGATEANR